MKNIFVTLTLLFVTLTANTQTCPDDNHPHAIDLGIGVKFACCNVGADKPEGYGGYYAWGETEEKNSYKLDNYQFCSYTQSGTVSFTQLGDISGTQYDVAQVLWGDSWRIPKSVDIQQLLQYECEHTVVSINGVNGLKFTGPNGNSIFLPFTGNKEGNSSNTYLGKSGNYWLSSQSNKANARLLSINNENTVYTTTAYRYIGRSIRPVYVERNGLQTCPDENHPHAIDLGLPSGILWACCNVGATMPESSGGYYAWGETEEKSNYYWNTYEYCNGSDYNCHDIGSDIAGTQYDVAHVKWGGTWQMPCLDQMRELLNYCESEWTTQNGVDGNVLRGPNGGRIFLPAVGYYKRSNLIDYGTFGHYWISHPFISGTGSAYGAYLYRLGVSISMDYGRCYGLSVRPINNTTSKIVHQNTSFSSRQAIYNIYGIKVANSADEINTLPLGIYIINGKKMVIK